ncbi:hypothetical protein BCR42DRAFT_409250 [Absidia repens]|uniref:Late embryogenesis abundant protein LEA-2 subgroup domain-containing protein n=1 Tax=Absidia repens TaxID=90262 RepID=A0A1X2IQW3_9FUNG|nr:hypothetical protein BCR42DRAFT_409250 [Absidia repens]
MYYGPISPHNPYQHYRKKSPTSYEDIIDPYRRHKSQPSDTTTSDQEAIHSRTVSDTSTSRLAANGVPYIHHFPSSSGELDDDPFAMSRAPNHTFSGTTDNSNDISHKTIPQLTPLESYQRANSYLPYSHHQRNPAQSMTPIYIEDDKQNTMQGVGSMLQDNLNVDMAQNEPRRSARNHKQQQQRRRYCGLTLRMWLILVVSFSVVFFLLMFFLIPRMPTVSFSSADTKQNQVWSPDKTALTAQWYVSMTVDNPNWIPTRLQKMMVSIEDTDTHKQIGTGMASPQWLSRRNKELIRLPINIAYSSAVNTTDETITDLFVICGPRRQSSGPALVQPELFNITLQIDLSVQGVPWSTHTTLVPPHGIQCPDY